MVAWERDDIEGVLTSVDGLEERVEGEPRLVRVVEGQAALPGPLGDAVLAGEQRTYFDNFGVEYVQYVKCVKRNKYKNDANIAAFLRDSNPW